MRYNDITHTALVPGNTKLYYLKNRIEHYIFCRITNVFYILWVSVTKKINNSYNDQPSCNNYTILIIKTFKHDNGNINWCFKINYDNDYSNMWCITWFFENNTEKGFATPDEREFVVPR